jgi:hypothetical protein
VGHGWGKSSQKIVALGLRLLWSLLGVARVSVVASGGGVCVLLPAYIAPCIWSS